MNKVFLGLGSNLGNRQQHLIGALEHLQNQDMVSITATSEFRNTPAESETPQPDYLNAVVEISTILTPNELLELTESIETTMGRQSKGLKDPRIIDIDILFYNETIISTDALIIPHPSAHERKFVLEPMNDIAPDFIHPILDEPIQKLLHTIQ